MNKIIFFNNIPSLLEQIGNLVTASIHSAGYAGLTALMFLENVFPPIPSELVLPLAGSLTLDGKFSLLGITLAGMIGSVAGAWVFYGLGYWLDERRVRLLIEKYGKWFLLSTSDLDRALSWFQRYGNWVIFFGRMVPMVRSLLSIPAGLARMNWLKFTLYTALGTACWSFILAFTGQTLGKNWGLVEQYIAQYEMVVLFALGIGLATFVVKKAMARNKI